MFCSRFSGSETLPLVKAGAGDIDKKEDKKCQPFKLLNGEKVV